MQLLINTSGQNNFIAIYHNDGSLLNKNQLESKANQTDELLGTIEKLCKNNSFDISEIHKILINTKAVSYTGIRVGVSTANALALALDVPVESVECSDIVPFKVDPTETGDNFSGFQSPKYQADPKITKSKTRI